MRAWYKFRDRWISWLSGYTGSGYRRRMECSRSLAANFVPSLFFPSASAEIARTAGVEIGFKSSTFKIYELEGNKSVALWSATLPELGTGYKLAGYPGAAPNRTIASTSSWSL